MSKKIWIIFITVFLTLSVYTSSTEQPEPIVPASAEFEQIKALVGVWEGTSESHGKIEKSSVEYSLTSGGSAIVEKLFPGTPHEMVSIYHDQNGKLNMTHYCMLGNQPVLSVVSSNSQEIQLELSKDSDIDADKEMHMHALKISFPDANSMIHEWTLFKEGKAADTTTITVKRLVNHP